MYSAGTGGYHVGSPPDSRSVRTCTKYGVSTNHRARQVTEDDFKEFDYLLAMDRENLEDLQEMANGFDKTERANLTKGSFKTSPWLIDSAVIWRLSGSRVKDR
jgi:protein-tyrosine-phosphatase